MQDFTSEKLYKLFQQLTSQNKIYIAYSGGVDSHVLLYSFCQLRLVYPALQIFALHINHGICANADNWQEHCQKICDDLSVRCLVKSVFVKSEILPGQSVEAAARNLRYQAFAAMMPDDNAVLLTAHHADDQAETLLLQLLRGAGPKGLASIPAQSKFPENKNIELLRPMLNFSRNAILQYAQNHNLEWIEDESNCDLRIERNYLRQQIVPLLKQHWPGMAKTFGRVATNCYEINQLAEILAEQDYAVIRGDIQNTLLISELTKLEPLRQRNVLRYFLQKVNLPLPSRIKIEQIQKTILYCTLDAQPVVAWAGAEVRRYGDYLYAMIPLSAHDENIVLSWDFMTPLTLPNDLGTLVAKFGDGEKKCAVVAITVRFRRGGERCQPRAKKHHCVLAKLFQEWKIPPWQRARIPLIYSGDELVMVVGYCKCEGWVWDIDQIRDMSQKERKIYEKENITKIQEY